MSDVICTTTSFCPSFPARIRLTVDAIISGVTVTGGNCGGAWSFQNSSVEDTDET